MHKPKPKNHLPLPDHAKKVFEGNRWSVYQWEQMEFDGNIKIYESVKRFDSVVIYPIIDEMVVIQEEEQPHWTKPHDSVIAGGIDDEEDIFTAAKRETEEETGMVFEQYFLVDVEQKAKDIHSYVYTFVAKNLVDIKVKNLDSGERNEIRQVSFEEFIDMVRKRRFFHKPHFIDEFIIQDKVDVLFDIFHNPEKYSIL